MTDAHGQPDSFDLDAYLDGTLGDQERHKMSRYISARPELQSEVNLQARIDEALRRSFAPSAPPAALLSKLRESAAARSAVVHMPRRRATLIAVATAATIVWGVLAWQFLRKDSTTPHYNPNVPLATIYETRVTDGFHPMWVCDDPREFATTFLTRQGQGLLLATLPEGITMEGLTYCGGISRYTTTMLARVDGAPVMVFVDRVSADTHPVQPAGNTNLHLFRKELGPLVLYELTPRDHPSLLDSLYLADVPPAK
jgi:hypothetical protein